MKRLTKHEQLIRCQEAAERRGGECLSPSYLNSQSKLLWRCNKGHEWLSIPNNIHKGSWCPYCYGNVLSDIEPLRKIAKDHGGECLSAEYVNSHTKLKWRCAEGHEWEASPTNIRQGQWCRRCAGLEKLTLESLQELAKQRGGELLSINYTNSSEPLLWRCSRGHEWKANARNVKNNETWCAVCAGKSTLTLEEMQSIAKERGGRCLSGEYQGVFIGLQWECSEGHTWFATPDSIKRGTWCATCSQGHSERICRDTFEKMFGERFPKVKPDWLLNGRGNRMEIDGYCEHLKIGFEYHGQQHYRFVKYFHGDETNLALRQQDDHLKRTLCREHDVLLIEVPFELPLEQLPVFIKQSLSISGRKISLVQPEAVKVASYVLREKLREMQQFAQSKGGKCLSEGYMGSNSKLIWECSYGHVWSAKPGHIKNGVWCPHCAGKAKLTLNEMQEIARSRGGECLSKEYVNQKTKLRWRCSQGHEWEALPLNVKRGKWCLACSGSQKSTIEEMQQIAESRGGACVSSIYINDRTKLRWRCSESHEWEAVPNSIKRGTWCPVCGRERK